MKKQRVFITGDMHGFYIRMANTKFFLNQYIEDEVYLIVAGDFSYLFSDDEKEKKMLDEFEEYPYEIVVVPGNHENYKAFRSYPIVDFHGAKAYEVRKNIHYIGNGEIFKIGGKSFFCMGGGFTLDRYQRRKDEKYWEEELPGAEEYKYALENIRRYREEGHKIEYIVSHAAPIDALKYLANDIGTDNVPEERELNNFLQYINELLADEKIMHFYGHLHIDKELPSLKQRVLLFDNVEIDLEE